MSVVTISGPRRFVGRVRVPGDKSISHRALMIAALGRRPCTIRGLSDGDDVVYTRRAVEALGATVENHGADGVTVTGGLAGTNDPVYLGNSGTGIRLLAGVVARFGFTTTLDGDASIRQRPMDRIIAPLTDDGGVGAGQRGERLAGPAGDRGASAARHRLHLAGAFRPR